MKKRVPTVLLAASLCFACEGDVTQENENKKIALDSVEKKASYTIGYNTARELKIQGYQLDVSAMEAGIRDAYLERSPMLDDNEMYAAMSTLQVEINERRHTRLTTQADENLKLGREFLLANKKREQVVTTQSGLQYEVLEEGSGGVAGKSDRVQVRYSGRYISGQVFDSGDNADFAVADAIPGWVEALQLMRLGARWRLYVPAHLAYGANGNSVVAPNSTLIFDIELLSIAQQDDVTQEDGITKEYQ